MATKTIVDYVLDVRTMIRDNGSYPNQAFLDTVDANGDPIPGSSPELRQFIQDSVTDHFSRWRPRKRPYTLNLLQGQTSYNLPDDWITVDNVSFDKAIMPAPLPDPDVYALPFVYTSQPLGVQLNTMAFNWYDDDRLLVLGSAPLAAYALAFDYYAYHTVDETGTTVPLYMQHYALLPAAEHALRAMATDYSVKLQKYKIGGRYGVEVDDSKIAESLLKQADSYAEQFRQDVILRPYMTSGGGE